MPTSDPDHKTGQGEWLPISTAPNTDPYNDDDPRPYVESILLGHPAWVRAVSGFYGHNLWKDEDECRLEPQPTHWQPLPAPPSREPEPPAEE